jgi:uncharacterized protein YfaS (alpha-2-macroglobulin family)
LTSQKPLQVLNRDLKGQGDDWANAQFKLDKPLPLGDYIGLAEVKSANSETDWNVFWFSVTDLGLIVKHDPEKFVVRAIDLTTLKPVPHAALEFIDEDNSKIYPSRSRVIQTGPDGFATVKSHDIEGTLNGPNLLLVGSFERSRAYSGSSDTSYESSTSRYRSYFYTERPVYRLGQTVYFKVLSRSLDADGFHTPKGITVNAAIEDPDNNGIWKGKFRCDDHGCFSGSFNIPEEGKTGAYQVIITYPDSSPQYNSFEVLEYRKPEYEVTVSPLEPRIVAGDKLKARVKASYYFGAPVANARVKYSVYASNDYESRYRLMARPSYYSYFDDWGDEDAEASGYAGSYSSGGDYITEGTVQTDAAGEAIIEIETKKLTPPDKGPYDSDYLDKTYEINAEVTDLSRMSVSGSGGCSVTAGAFALFVQPDNYVAGAGSPIAATLTAVDYDGKPVTGQAVTVQLVRWIWDGAADIYRGTEKDGELSVVTDAEGKAKFAFETKHSLATDNYSITATAKDTLGNTIYDQSRVWIANEDYPYVRNGTEAEKQSLTVTLDKKVYKPGETALAMITAPVSGKEGVDAIVSIEGPKILKYWTVPMTATAKSFTIPILSSYEPNVFVNVTLVGAKAQYYNESRIIRVSPQQHSLNFNIATDQQKYHPGDTAKYTIKVTNQEGQPVPDTELSLGLVDESIYAIRSDMTPDILKFFYARRENSVSTSCTFDQEYSGGPNKIEPKVRKDFRDTAAWISALKTDKNGIALASIKLPDNLTTWRATVRGISSGTDVGAATNKIISTQDLIVRLALPRFFSVGDQTFISAVVHNYTRIPQPIKLTLSASSQFQVQEKTEQNLNVLPDKAARFSWPVKLIESGQADVMVKAIGKTAADAMETRLNVLALGVPAFSVKSGALTDDPSSVSIPLYTNDAVVPGTLKYHLGLSGSSIGPVLGCFDTLIDYPYGCTEQTMSRLMPSVVAMALHKKLGLAISPELTKKFAKVYKLSMAKLIDYQHSDGGWGWWETDESNPYLTSLVIEGFKQLQQVGYRVDKKRIEKGVAWMSTASDQLTKQLDDPKHVPEPYTDRAARTDLAKMAYAQSLYRGKPSPAVMTSLINHLDELSPDGLCYLTLSLKKFGDARSATTYKRLMNLASRHGEFVDWDHTTALFIRMGLPTKHFGYDYRFTGVETTALALRTVLVMEPSNSELIEAIKHWLLLQRDTDGWENTKTTSQVFLALLEEQLAFNRINPPVAALTVNLADKLLDTLQFNQTNAYGPEKDIVPPALALPSTLNLSKTGSGRLYYNSLMTYIRSLKPGENIATQGSPEGLSVDRTFYRLSPSATTSDGKIHFRSDKISDNIVRAGETVLMRISVNTPVALPYVVLEAYLPSGAEVVSDNSKKNLFDHSQDAGFEGDWSPMWWTHQDILDDRIVFFVTHLRAGKSEFSTLVRMEMPGTYQINPMRLEGMYSKNVRTYSNLGSIRVTE